MVTKNKKATNDDKHAVSNQKTFFSKDIQKLHETIKDYLNNQEFENTLECFEHEIKTKILNKQLTEITVDIGDTNTPELFKLMKGDSNKNQQERIQSKVYHETLRKYLDLLTAARQIFSASVSLIQKTELNEAVISICNNKNQKGYER